jgi:hypothetical protein
LGLTPDRFRGELIRGKSPAFCSIFGGIYGRKRAGEYSTTTLTTLLQGGIALYSQTMMPPNNLELRGTF